MPSKQDMNNVASSDVNINDNELAPIEKTMLASDDSIVALNASQAITQQYHDALVEVQEPSCIIEVNSTKIPSGYKELVIESCNDCVSYRDDDGFIEYRILTHKLVGSSIEFGVTCDSDGTMELYSYSTSSDVDCRKLTSRKLAHYVTDPMFALVSEDCLYIIYNVPSEFALSSTPLNRRPDIEQRGEDGKAASACASGVPNIVKFNLVTKEAHRLLPKMMPMSFYMASLFNVAEEPALLITNIFDTFEEEIERPTLLSLADFIFDGDASKLPAQASFPKGISVLRFIDDVNITQVGLNGKKTLGVHTVILERSDDASEEVIKVIEKSTEDEDD